MILIMKNEKLLIKNSKKDGKLSNIKKEKIKINNKIFEYSNRSIIDNIKNNETINNNFPKLVKIFTIIMVVKVIVKALVSFLSLKAYK